MRFIYGILIASVLFVSATGCCNKNSGCAAPVDDSIAITSSNLDRIAGMQWILKEMVIDGSQYQLEKEKPFVKFGADGKVNGFASVNNFFGSIDFDPAGQIQWPNAFGSTRMAGPANMMKQENAFLKALPMTETVSLKKIFLTFTSQDGLTKLVFFVPVH